MENLVEYIVKNIVSNPDDVVVELSTQESMDGRISQIYTISVNPEDIGTVIGKSGRTIKSIRSLAKVKAIKEGSYIDVKIKEDEEIDQAIEE